MDQDHVEQRMRMAAESILDNEALRGGLDEAGSAAMLDWGIACAQQIARDTREMDDLTAEEAMDPRMRGLRYMLRAVKELASASATPQTIEKLLENAQKVYGDRFIEPDRSLLDTLNFGSNFAQDEIIHFIRSLLEYTDTTQGEEHAYKFK